MPTLNVTGSAAPPAFVVVSPAHAVTMPIANVPVHTAVRHPIERPDITFALISTPFS